MKHVSFSQLMTYVRCPEHYLFHYVLGIKHPPRKAFKHGFAIHETFARHFTQKKEDAKGLNVSEAKEFFEFVLENGMEDYAAELEETKKLLTKEYLSKEKMSPFHELLDLGKRGIEVYYKKLNPKISPDLVEAAFEFPVENAMKVIGRIDLIDTKNVIHEMKTTRRTPPRQDIAQDLQLVIYQIGFEQLKKRKPAGISKDYIVLGKRESKIVQLQLQKPFFQKEAVLRNIVLLMEAVRRGIFYCLHPADSWVCSKEWCGYSKLHQAVRKRGLERFIHTYGA